MGGHKEPRTKVERLQLRPAQLAWDWSNVVFWSTQRVHQQYRQPPPQLRGCSAGADGYGAYSCLQLSVAEIR